MGCEQRMLPQSNPAADSFDRSKKIFESIGTESNTHKFLPTYPLFRIYSFTIVEYFVPNRRWMFGELFASYYWPF